MENLFFKDNDSQFEVEQTEDKCISVFVSDEWTSHMFILRKEQIEELKEFLNKI